MTGQIGRAISLLPHGHLDQVVHTLTEAHELLVEVTHGSQDPEVHQSVRLLEEAVAARQEMVELEVWYDQEPENDFRAGDPPIVVRTSDELDALIDRVLTETKDHRVGAIIQVGIRGHSGYPILEVGLGREKGFINYHANDGGSTEGAGNADELAEYVYMGNLSEVPADVEVPVPLVRQGLHEFFRTGERPSVVRSSSRA